MGQILDFPRGTIVLALPSRIRLRTCFFLVKRQYWVDWFGLQEPNLMIKKYSEIHVYLIPTRIPHHAIKWWVTAQAVVFWIHVSILVALAINLARFSLQICTTSFVTLLNIVSKISLWNLSCLNYCIRKILYSIMVAWMIIPHKMLNQKVNIMIFKK